MKSTNVIGSNWNIFEIKRDTSIVQRKIKFYFIQDATARRWCWWCYCCWSSWKIFKIQNSLWTQSISGETEENSMYTYIFIKKRKWWSRSSSSALHNTAEYYNNMSSSKNEHKEERMIVSSHLLFLFENGKREDAIRKVSEWIHHPQQNGNGRNIFSFENPILNTWEVTI